jgi:hypothetical protein
MTGTNFSNWYNTSQGSMVLNIGYCNGGAFPYLFTIQASDSERNYLVKDSATATSATPFTYQIVGGGNTVTSATISQNSTKIGMSYSANGTANVVSDITTASSTALKTVTTPTSFQIGYSATYGRQMNGTIKKFAYYPIQVTNAQLTALTG